jgi:N-glycosidase YbiA
MSEPITDFRGDHDFLSNFYPSPLKLEGAEYPTLEHAFQAAKTFDHDLRRKVRQAKSPSEAKRMGARLERRKDWFNVSLQLMEDLVRQKFTRYADLRVKLIATGDALLIEGNTWDDRFYGCVWDSHKGEWVGENHLGRLLMKVREEIRPEPPSRQENGNH